MRRTVLVLLPLAALAGCASARKAGDRAAATGDWKAAEASYAQALRDDPGDPGKRARWQDARARALQGAADRCRACQVARDWECALDEAGYLARLEPGNADHAALRVELGRHAAHARLERARMALQVHDHRGALAALAAARAASNDPALQAEAARLQPVVVAGAVGEAMQLRTRQQYPEALELLGAAARLDGGVRTVLDQVRAEHDRWLDARYETEARRGDALLRERRFGEAAAAYDAAERLRRGGRAEPLARYARLLQAGDAAVRRKDWAAATRAFDEAVRSGQDGKGGYARTLLDRVQVRPWALRVRSASVRPLRPDGRPWAGAAGPGYQRVVGLLAGAAPDGRGGVLVAGVDPSDALPRENRPSLVVIVRLPDGRRFATPPQRALRARLESYVVFATNAFDDRPVAVRVVHQDEQGDVEVGAVSLRTMDLLTGGEVALSDRSLVELRVAAERSGEPDGSAQGFVEVAARR